MGLNSVMRGRDHLGASALPYCRLKPVNGSGGVAISRVRRDRTHFGNRTQRMLNYIFVTEILFNVLRVKKLLKYLL